MTATDAQVRLAMKERQKGRTQTQAAAKANLRSRKTLRKHVRLGQLPSELKALRAYRTRPDPFEADGPELEALLEQAPELDARVLFDWLGERRPGHYDEGQLRTLQRRVSVWRALHRQALLTLEQVHRPGEVLQTDGTWMNTLGITLGGQAFPHLLIHCVLPYSNWEWGRVAQSESLLSIRPGLQSALTRLGHVPAIHQTDNTTAATHHLEPHLQGQSLAEHGYNPDYLQLLAHFGSSRAPFMSPARMRTALSRRPTARSSGRSRSTCCCAATATLPTWPRTKSFADTSLTSATPCAGNVWRKNWP